MVDELAGLIDFYTSQFITAHGSFGDYKESFKLSLNRGCPACGSEIDNPENVLFSCQYYNDQRKKLLHAHKIARREDLVKLMPNHPEAIRDFKRFCKFAIHHKPKIPDDQSQVRPNQTDLILTFNSR